MSRFHSDVGMTLDWVGDKIGYARPSVSQIFAGLRPPTMRLMRSVQDGVGWQLTDQVRHVDNDYVDRLQEVMESLYLVELTRLRSGLDGAIRCAQCGVWNGAGETGDGCWNCGKTL